MDKKNIEKLKSYIEMFPFYYSGKFDCIEIMKGATRGQWILCGKRDAILHLSLVLLRSSYDDAISQARSPTIRKEEFAKNSSIRELLIVIDESENNYNVNRKSGILKSVFFMSGILALSIFALIGFVTVIKMWL